MADTAPVPQPFIFGVMSSWFMQRGTTNDLRDHDQQLQQTALPKHVQTDKLFSQLLNATAPAALPLLLLAQAAVDLAARFADALPFLHLRIEQRLHAAAAAAAVGAAVPVAVVVRAAAGAARVLFFNVHAGSRAAHLPRRRCQCCIVLQPQAGGVDAISELPEVVVATCQ